MSLFSGRMECSSECGHWGWVQITVPGWGGESSGDKRPRRKHRHAELTGERSFRTPRQGEAYHQQRRVSLLVLPLTIIWAPICLQWASMKAKVRAPTLITPSSSCLFFFFKKLDSAMLWGNIRANVDSHSCHPCVGWRWIKKLLSWGNEWIILLNYIFKAFQLICTFRITYILFWSNLWGHFDHCHLPWVANWNTGHFGLYESWIRKPILRSTDMGVVVRGNTRIAPPDVLSHFTHCIAQRPLTRWEVTTCCVHSRS